MASVSDSWAMDGGNAPPLRLSGEASRGACWRRERAEEAKQAERSAGERATRRVTGLPGKERRWATGKKRETGWAKPFHGLDWVLSLLLFFSFSISNSNQTKLI